MGGKEEIFRTYWDHPLSYTIRKRRNECHLPLKDEYNLLEHLKGNFCKQNNNNKIK